MAGKRLVDAAKLLDAARSIARQHLVLRQQQWEVYSKTSSLAKVVKHQTDRVTVTAGAAFELARKLNDVTPSRESEQAQRVYETAKDRVARQVKSFDSVREAEISRPQASDASDIPREPGHSGDDGNISSSRRREVQRQSQQRIPAIIADEQAGRDQTNGRDTFSMRTDSVSSEISSLPRIKIPKHPGSSQGSDGHVSDDSLNQDVYYTPQEKATDARQFEDEAKDVNTDVFLSRSVSSMLGKSGLRSTNPFAGRKKLTSAPLPEMLEAEERRRQQQQQQSQQQQGPTSVGGEAGLVAPSDHLPSSTRDEEMRQLAGSIAREAEAHNESARDDVDLQTQVESSVELRESRVPSSRVGRLWQYGGLATSMTFGAIGEGLRRFAGGSNQGSLMLSEGNMNRLVAKLSRMRGAALKLGQMISFQDAKVLPPTINAVLQRVQDSADYMPPSQRDQVLIQNLGRDWRDLFSYFEEKPFAAASIGQVHRATLDSNGKAVAVKIQYPGVRNSIDSDLKNLSLLLTASRLLPKGLFLDKTIANARTELGWECDYEREAQACMRFRELLSDEPDVFTVPEVFAAASGPGVLTADFMTGTAVTRIKGLTQQDRDWIGTQVLRLCLRELMEWRFMQTDPNWTNFLYNQDTQKLELLDFGASRDFPDKFVEPYVSLLIAASRGDRNACRDRSIELGYLTGHETKDMLKAHVDSILTLAEPFVESAPEVYDFEDQTITDRVRANIGLMLRERLAPPPEETYSLHRKLSGAFLLCARLRSKVQAREMFRNAVEVWTRRASKV